MIYVYILEAIMLNDMANVNMLHALMVNVSPLCVITLHVVLLNVLALVKVLSSVREGK